MVIELMRQFFNHERIYRVSDQSGRKSFASFSNAMMHNSERELMFDIDVTIQRENPYSRDTINKTIMELWSSGMLSSENRDTAIVAIKNMQFDGKERLIADFQALGNEEETE